jgi:AraC-like DNA-binding protein
LNAGADEWTRYRRVADLGVEVLGAHFVAHVYHRHTHDSYSFGFTEDGVQAFRCRGGAFVSTAGLAMAFNPDDPHDGHTGSPTGFTYQMVHVDPGQVRAVLAEAGAPAGLPLFADPLISDPELVARIRRAAGRVLAGSDPLATQEAVDAMLVAAVGRHASRSGQARPATTGGPALTGGPATTGRPATTGGPAAVGRVRDLLHDRYADQLRGADLASAAGRSRFQVYRDFQARYGMPPSAYLRQVRLRAARRLLAAGRPPAQVAAAVGFADQPHLTRWFRRAYGITPAVYQRCGV